MKPEREVIEVNFEELTALLERARQGPLAEDGKRQGGLAGTALSWGRCKPRHH